MKLPWFREITRTIRCAPSPARDLRELGLQVAFSDRSGPLKRRLEPFVLSEA
jgi:hypothetical protein